MNDLNPQNPNPAPGNQQFSAPAPEYVDDEPLPRRMYFPAIAGLIAGVVIIGPLGIILSILAMRTINKHPDIYFGRGVAIAGIIVSSFASLWQALYIWALIAS